MEANTTRQVQATFTMLLHLKAEAITIKAAGAIGLNAERAGKNLEMDF
jgi:hypothetical protein